MSLLYNIICPTLLGTELSQFVGCRCYLAVASRCIRSSIALSTRPTAAYLPESHQPRQDTPRYHVSVHDDGDQDLFIRIYENWLIIIRDSAPDNVSEGVGSFICVRSILVWHEFS